MLVIYPKVNSVDIKGDLVVPGFLVSLVRTTFNSMVVREIRSIVCWLCSQGRIWITSRYCFRIISSFVPCLNMSLGYFLDFLFIDIRSLAWFVWFCRSVRKRRVAWLFTTGSKDCSTCKLDVGKIFGP